MEILFTAFLFGLIAGILPGPMLTSGFMTIIKNPKGIFKVLYFPLVAGGVEISIGLIMLTVGIQFFTDQIIFVLTIFGIINILYIAYSIFKNKESFMLAPSKNTSAQLENYMAISYKDSFLLTLFNGPLYMFWLSVCLPLAIEADKSIFHGGIFFILLMVFGVAIMTLFLFFLMHISRKSFQNAKVMKVIPYIITMFFVFIAIKMCNTALTLYPF